MDPVWREGWLGAWLWHRIHVRVVRGLAGSWTLLAALPPLHPTSGAFYKGGVCVTE